METVATVEEQAMETHIVKTVREFVCTVETKAIKITLYEALHDVFAIQEENGQMDLKYSLNKLYDFRTLFEFLDQIQEYQNVIYPTTFKN